MGKVIPLLAKRMEEEVGIAQVIRELEHKIETAERSIFTLQRKGDRAGVVGLKTSLLAWRSQLNFYSES